MAVSNPEKKKSILDRFREAVEAEQTNEQNLQQDDSSDDEKIKAYLESHPWSRKVILEEMDEHIRKQEGDEKLKEVAGIDPNAELPEHIKNLQNNWSRPDKTQNQ